MARGKGTTEIEHVSEDEGRAHLKETYADPERAGKFFDQLVDTRRKALDQFTEELNGDEDLAERFARSPIELLNKRKLIGPLDEISIEGLTNPFVDFPWPWPFCRIRCSYELVVETHWVCAGWWPFRICWPVFHLHWRLVCRVVCD